MPQDGEVFRCVIFSYATLILAEGNIKDPVEAILDTPMASHCGSDVLRATLETHEIVLCFQAGLSVYVALSLYHDDR